MADAEARYARAAKAIAGAADGLMRHLGESGSITHAEAVQVTVAAVPTISREVLGDPDIMDEQEEEQ